MGSRAAEADTQEEINVVVTGFAPFRADQFPINPSFEIARRLPAYLPLDASSRVVNPSAVVSQPRVRITTRPDPITVTWHAAHRAATEEWEKGADGNGKRIDYMLHIGMASSRKYYSIERRGHRDGYVVPDEAGKLPDATDRKGWDSMPAELLTGLDIDDIWRRWKTRLPRSDLRVSETAGNWICDFTFFTSLALLEGRKEERRVLFLHVPGDADAVSIDTGVEVALGLIRAMVLSGQAGKVLE